MAGDPYRSINTRETPQSEAIPGTVQNSAGGHSFPVDNWTRLHRFLILGTEGGTYYISEPKLTKENAHALFSCIKEDGPRVVRLIEEISVAGRNPKQNPVIFALAACAGAEDPATRKAALEALPRVCRIGTHLFMFAGYVEQFRGWGRGLRTAVADWYMNHKDIDYQLAKYRQRGGWSHRDLLRLSKPRPEPGSHLAGAFAWAVGKPLPENGSLAFLHAVNTTQTSKDLDVVTGFIGDFNLSWEMVNSELLSEPRIWEALIPRMGVTALVRNLGRLTANGTLKPLSKVESDIVKRLSTEDQILKSRIHPMQVLLAASTYGDGGGFRGSLKWTPSNQVLGALDGAFKMSFPNVEPAGKRTLVALDVSGSMSAPILNTSLSCREAGAALTLVTLASEPACHVVGFSGGMVPLPFTRNTTVGEAVRFTERLPFDRTDCAQPMLYALDKGLDVDTFIVITDSETWAGQIHPVQALRKYRDRTGIPAKLVVVAMTSNGFSIADPSDAGMLDVVGFDSASASVISDFSAGRI